MKVFTLNLSGDMLVLKHVKFDQACKQEAALVKAKTNSMPRLNFQAN